MKNLLLLIFFTSTQLACFCISAFGQGWEKVYGGQGFEQGGFVEETSDGGFIITGSTTSYGSGEQDIYLIKTDISGDTLWTKSFGGIMDDFPSEILSADSCFIIVGSTESYGIGLYDIYLLKIDYSGNLIWEKTYGNSGNDIGNSVELTIDGGLLIAGYKTHHTDLWLIKTNFQGDTVWTKEFNGYVNPTLRKTIDGGFVITVTNVIEEYTTNIAVMKFDSNGILQWEKNYGGIKGESGWDIQQTKEGDFIITGWTESFSAGDADVFVLKINAVGDTIWLSTAGGNGNDYGESIWQTQDEGFLISGFTGSFGDQNIYLIKLNSFGNILWSKTFGGQGWSYGFNCIETIGKSILISGYTNSFSTSGDYNLYLIKTDSLGNICYPSSLSQSPNICFGDSFIVGANVYHSSGTYVDTLKTKYGGCDSVITTHLTVVQPPVYSENFSLYESQASSACDNLTALGNEIRGEELIKIYPNPSQGIFTLALSAVEGQSSAPISSITITNLMGEKVFEQKYPLNLVGDSPLSAAEGGVPIRLKQQKGIYFLEIELYSKKENTAIRSRSITKIILQ